MNIPAISTPRSSPDAYGGEGAHLLAGPASYLQSLLPADRRLSLNSYAPLSNHDSARICMNRASSMILGYGFAGQGFALSNPDSTAGPGSCQIAIAVFMRRKPSLP